MALKNSVLLDIGMKVEGAYVRIDTISGYKDRVDMTVNTYVSREAFLEGYSYVKQETVQFIPSVEAGSENFIKQGYEYLKSLPEYEQAINVPMDGSPD